MSRIRPVLWLKLSPIGHKVENLKVAHSNSNSYILEDLPPGKYRLRFKLLQDQNGDVRKNAVPALIQLLQDHVSNHLAPHSLTGPKG